MKPVLFIICFTLGVSLMIFSGYVPQSASARGNGDATENASARAGHADGQEFVRTVTRRVGTSAPGGETEETGVTGAADDVYAAPPEPVAAQDQPAAENVEPAPDLPEPPPTPEPDAGDASDEPESEPPPEPDVAPLFADAGPDRVIWLGWDELPLDGSATTGSGVTCEWQQVSGPATLVIENPAALVTVARGLRAGQRASWRGVTYEYELTVTDAAGERDVDTVKYIVQAAPPLKIKPTPERRFEWQDGFELAYFTAWITNLESYEAVFEVTSPTELRFTRITGGLAELSGRKSEGVFVYQFTVYAQAGEATSWVEYLADTEDKVPAVVQLGVNWESP